MVSVIKTWSTPVPTGVSAEESRLIPCALCGGSRFNPALKCEGFAYVRCARCGLVQMNPQPSAAAVSRRYQDTFGNDYLSYELANESAFLNLQLLALKDAGFDVELFKASDLGHDTVSRYALIKEDIVWIASRPEYRNTF